MMLRITLLPLSLLAIINAANADTAYLKPSTFTPSLDQMITIEASFNDECCNPKYPVRSDDYQVVLPDGTSVIPDRIESFSNSIILEHKITQSGTTRISTGERLGRKGGRYVFLEGEYSILEEGDTLASRGLPEDLEILTSQTLTVTDAFVTIGTPNWSAVNKPIGRLVFTPSQHPSMLKTGERFDLTLTFDGEVVIDEDVVLTRAGQKDRENDDGLTFKTDENGRVSLPLEHIGTHLIMARKQAKAPTGAETDIRSYTTSLAFDVSKP